MSRLQELIDQLCPDGVEWKPLTDVCLYVRGITFNKKQQVGKDFEGSVGVLRANNIDLGSMVLTLSDLIYVSPDVRIKSEQYLCKDDILICAGSGSRAHIGKVALADKNYGLAFGGFMAVIRCLEAVEPVYVFNLLRSYLFARHLEMALATSTINNLNVGVMKEFRIPVPPIEVQREIVRILDSFQELDDALTAEIEAREKQLDAMRARAYSDAAYPMTRLGDIGRFERGKRFTRSQMGGDGVPCIHYGDIYTKCRYWANAPVDRLTDNAPAILRYASKGDVVIAATSENAEDVCTAIVWNCDEQAAVHDDCQILHHEQNPLYMALFFNSEPFAAQKMRFVTESKVVRISGAEMAQTMIPLPPVQVQDRIAQSMSDCIHLMDHLRSERDARRKQFAYYRDKLLAFPELSKEVNG